MNMVWYDEASSFGDITGVITSRREGLDRISQALFGHPFHWNLLRGGRGHGKVALQKQLLERAERNPLAARMARPLPSVDVEKIRWRCAPPTAPRPQRGTFWDLQNRITDAFTSRNPDSSFLKDWMRDYDARYGTSTAKPSVGHNVNVVTDRIPPHIAALPEPEQGPALVEAIFERKRRAQGVSDAGNA